jgi:hypothetical protein
MLSRLGEPQSGPRCPPLEPPRDVQGKWKIHWDLDEADFGQKSQGQNNTAQELYLSTANKTRHDIYIGA